MRTTFRPMRGIYLFVLVLLALVIDWKAAVLVGLTAFDVELD